MSINTVVLDSDGLSAWIAQDRKVTAMIKVFHRRGAELVVGANTVVEVMHARVSLNRLDRLLSRTRVETATEESAKAAARLLKETGLHGQKYAVDATVAEMALRQPGPVMMVTSDLDDMARLCGGRIRLLSV